mgnify:CR=1 FL=1
MEHEVLWRIGVFLGVLLVIAGLERLAPRRRLIQPKARRWATNLGLVVIDALTVRALALVLPILAVAAAVHSPPFRQPYR